MEAFDVVKRKEGDAGGIIFDTEEEFDEFCRGENSECGSFLGSPATTWRFYISEVAIAQFVNSLDDRGINERNLRNNLRELIDKREKNKDEDERDLDDDTVWLIKGDIPYLTKNLQDVKSKLQWYVNKETEMNFSVPPQRTTTEPEVIINEPFPHIDLKSIPDLKKFETNCQRSVIERRIRRSFKFTDGK